MMGDSYEILRRDTDVRNETYQCMEVLVGCESVDAGIVSGAIRYGLEAPHGSLSPYI